MVDRLAQARAAAAAVQDPEIPVLTIEDLGILRDVRLDGDGVEVTITPTYSGCPAMNVIAWEIEAALSHAGFTAVRVRSVLSPGLDDRLDVRGRAPKITGIWHRAAGPIRASGMPAMRQSRYRIDQRLRLHAL